MVTYTLDGYIKGTFTGTITEDVAPPDIEQPPPDVEQPPDIGQIPPPDYSTPATVLIGPSRDYTEPADALAVVFDGGIMELDDAVYVKPVQSSRNITIRSASGNPYKCIMDGQGGYGGGHKLMWGKGMLHTSKSLTVIGIGFRNCGSPASGTNYSNEAGVWIGDTDTASPEVVTVQRCAFDNNANGIFAAYDQNVKIRVLECLFGYIASNGHNAASTGQGGGPAHDCYLGVGEVEVAGCMFWGCCAGHNVKSRAPYTHVHDNPCMTQDGGRAFELPDGGQGWFSHNVVHTRTDRIDQPPQGTYGNANMIAYCSESTGQGTQGMTMSDNTLHVSRTNSTIWAAAGRITSSGDVVHYYSNGSLQLQGDVQGIGGGSAPPGSPAPPALPRPPSWAGGGAVVLQRDLVTITEPVCEPEEEEAFKQAHKTRV
jgi:hypothetical protein